MRASAGTDRRIPLRRPRDPDRDGRFVAACVAIPSVLCGALELATPALASDVLGLDAAGAGPLAAALGVGAMLGAALAAGLGGRTARAPLFVTSLGLSALATLALGLARQPGVMIALLGACGVANGCAWVSGATMIQVATPAHTQLRTFGRVEGYETASLAALMLGIGVSASRLGIATGVAMLGLTAALAIPFLRPRLRAITRAAAPSEARAPARRRALHPTSAVIVADAA
ncbi:MAG: hypothetical protein R3F16_17400 [Myxococcota bacterium]